MKKFILTLLISLFALNVVAQEENTNFRYEVSSSYTIDVGDVYKDVYKSEKYDFRVKLDTQTGKMWLLIYERNSNNRDRCFNSTYRKQYSINTQVLPAENDQSKPGRYTFCPGSFGNYSCRFILDKVTGNVYYLLLSNTLNSWKLVPF